MTGPVASGPTADRGAQADRFPDSRRSRLSDLLRRWQDGWARCRGLDPAEEVGDPGDALVVTHALPGRDREVIALRADDDPASLDRLTRWIPADAAVTWLTVPTRHPMTVRTSLTAAGLRVSAETETFMTTDLRRDPPMTPPAPYTVRQSDDRGDGGVVGVRVVDSDGVEVARGMVAVAGADAVVHAIQTEPAHRRRGLGRVVTAHLCARAAERGARTGLLVASTAGECLYRALGWSPRATVLVATRPGEQAADPC